MLARRSTVAWQTVRSAVLEMRWSSIPLALLPIAAALAVDPAGWSPFGPAKWLVVSVLALVGLAALFTDGRVRFLGWATGALTLFVLWSALAAALGLDRWSSWLGTPERHLGVLTWVLCLGMFVAGQSRSSEGDARLLRGGAVVALAGIGIYCSIEAIWGRPIAVDIVTSRLGGPFGSAAYLGAASVLLTPLAVGMAFDHTVRGWARIGSAFAALGGAVAVVGSGTRGAWLGMLVAIGILAAFRWRWISTHIGSFTTIVAVAAAIAALVLSLKPLRHGVHDLVDRGQVSSTARVDEWRVALRVIADHPVVGVGPESYRLAFPGKVDAAYERAYGRVEVPDRAHDVVLDVAATTGIPGVLLYLVAALGVAAAAVRALLRGKAADIGLAVGLLAHAAQQVVLFPLGEWEPTVWLLAGVLVARTTPVTSLRSIKLPRLGAWVFSALALVAAVGGTFEVLADRSARDALRDVSANRVGSAVDAGVHAASLRPDVIRYRLVAARAYDARGTIEDLDRAIAQVRHARSWSPLDPVVRSTEARLVARRAQLSGDRAAVDGASALWREVVAADPQNADDWLQYGLVSILRDDLATGERALLRAEDLAPKQAAPSVDLARLYLRQGRVADAKAAGERAKVRGPNDPAVVALLADLAATG
jgi:O-antigen ligase